MAKAPNKNDKAAPAGAETAPKKSKLPLLVALGVLLAAAGGGAWYFLGRSGETAGGPAKAQAPRPPVFVPLDPFTVNLSSDGGEQYLQLAATLKVLDQAAADTLKQYMPEVRHKTLTLLSSKRPAEILTGAGRERLAEEIRQTANNIVLAAAGRPVKPIVLDVPVVAAAAPAPKAEEGAEPAAKPAEEAAPAQPAEAAGPAAAARPATTLARAAPDDPVQSVFFTSFIIQ